jgi:heme A synthase
MSAGQGAALVIGGLIFIAAFVWMLARLDRAQRRRIERNRQARWAAGATGGAIAGG